MNSKRLWVITIVTVLGLFAAGPHSPGVWAQNITSASCRPGWEWNQNSLGQDPCSIASIVEEACRETGIYKFPLLNSSDYYIPPKNSSVYDIKCECNTVLYSLIEACSTCQGADTLSWTIWVSSCSTSYSLTVYPYDIPPGTAIPRWAFYDVTSLADKTYSDNVAISVGRNPEATPKPLTTLSVTSTTKASIPPSTVSLVSSSSSASYPTQTRGGSNINDDGSDNKSNTGAIVGGVVGTIVPLIIIGVVVALFLRRRREGRVPPHIQEASERYRQPPISPTSPTLTTASTNLPYSTHHNAYGPQGQGRHNGTPEV